MNQIVKLPFFFDRHCSKQFQVRKEGNSELPPLTFLISLNFTTQGVVVLTS